MINFISSIFHHLFVSFVKLEILYFTNKFGFFDKTAKLGLPRIIMKPNNIYMYENTNIWEGLTFLSLTGKFILKKNSGAAQGLTVVTNNHSMASELDHFRMEEMKSKKKDIDHDIIVEEDVWIGANVTLTCGVTIGRGSVIGAGAIIRKNVPPYSVVIGNPARVVSFVFTPDEIVEREKILYNKDERLSPNLLKKNYIKYFLTQLDNIKHFFK